MNFGAPDAITDVSSQLAMSKNRAGYGIKRAKGNSAIMNVASGVQDFGIGSSQFPGMDMNSFNFNGMPGGLGAMGSDINTDYSAAYSQSNQQQWGNIGNYSNYSVPDPTNNSYVQNTYSDSDANYFYQQQQQQLLQQQASNEAPARRSRFGTAVPPPIPPPGNDCHRRIFYVLSSN